MIKEPESLQDVVAYKCELLAQAFSSELSGADIKEMQRQFFKMWMENIDFLKLIVVLHRTDIIWCGASMAAERGQKN